MNEATGVLLWIAIIVVCSLAFYLLGRRHNDGSGLSGTESSNGSVGECNKRARDNNQQLEDAERETADTIREQGADIARADDLNKSARDLVQKGKEILDYYNNTK